MALADCTLEDLISPRGYACSCGRIHRVALHSLKIGQGAVAGLPEALRAIGCKHPFVVFDRNTEIAAMTPVRAALDGAGFAYTEYRIPLERVEPDEHTVGSLCMAPRKVSASVPKALSARGSASLRVTQISPSVGM